MQHSDEVAAAGLNLMADVHRRRGHKRRWQRQQPEEGATRGLTAEAWEAALEAEFEGLQALEDGDEVKEGMMKGYTIHFDS